MEFEPRSIASSTLEPVSLALAEGSRPALALPTKGTRPPWEPLVAGSDHFAGRVKKNGAGNGI